MVSRPQVSYLIALLGSRSSMRSRGMRAVQASFYGPLTIGCFLLGADGPWQWASHEGQRDFSALGRRESCLSSSADAVLDLH